MGRVRISVACCHGSKGAPVMNSRAEPRQCGEMFWHAVAFVVLEPVPWIKQTEAGHQPVAGNLRNDRGCCNRGDQRVPADDRLAFATNIDAITAMNKDQLRTNRERGDPTRESPERRAPDVTAPE